MKFKLYFDYGDHVDDLIIEGDDLSELQRIAQVEVAKRKPNDYWSEEVK